MSVELQEQKPQILVITGISGAGRSTVANVLEDEGWYVIDNIPPQMLESLAELVTRDGARVPRVALGIDVRARACLMISRLLSTPFENPM